MKKNLICAILVAIFIVGPLTYLLSDRGAPYEYLSGEVLPPVPHVADQISIHWRVRVNRFCPGWVQRDITDKRGYVWRNTGGPVKIIPPVKQGAVVDIVNTLDLPRQLGPQSASYQAHVCYRCNPLQRWWPICVSTPRLEFAIQ